MIKKRYFTISKKGRYGGEDVIFRFENLDGAMSMFKYLMEGKQIDLDHESVPNGTDTPDEDGYVGSEYVYVEKGEAECHLNSETIDVYTKEEYEALKKEREERVESFKKKEVTKK